MTKEEIKAMIAQKIGGGQGTNLDAASVLPTILNWIIDNIGGGDIPIATDEITGGIKTGWTPGDALLAPAGFTTDNNGKLAMSMASVENSADFSTVMSLTEFNINVFALNADVQDVLAGRYLFVRYEDYILSLQTLIMGVTAVYGGKDMENNIGFSIIFEKAVDGYIARKYEL